MKKNYLKINESKDSIEIQVYLENQELEEKKLNASMKQIVKIIKRNNRKKKEIMIDTDLDLEKDEKKDNKRLSLIAALNACKIKDKNERLEYIYMAACKYLDNEYIEKNICEFCNDICLGKKKYNVKNGCCHEFKLKNIFYPKNLPLCQYQKEGKCIANCLGCKLFACDEVRKKGVKLTYYNVPLVRYFFNFAQKIMIRFSLFTHKDTVLKRLRLFNF